MKSFKEFLSEVKNKTHFDKDIGMEVPDFAYKMLISNILDDEFPDSIKARVRAAMPSNLGDDAELYAIWSALDATTRKLLIDKTIVESKIEVNEDATSIYNDIINGDHYKNMIKEIERMADEQSHGDSDDYVRLTSNTISKLVTKLRSEFQS